MADPLRRLRAALRPVALVLLFLLALPWAGARAGDVEPEKIRTRFAEIERSVEGMLRDAGSLRLSEAAVQRLAEEALRLRAEVDQLRVQARAEADAERALLEALGKPAEGGEAEDVVRRRRALEASVAQAEGWVQQADLVSARMERMLDQLSGKRFEALARTLLEAKPTPLDPRNWLRAAGEAAQILAVVQLSLGVWAGRLVSEPEVLHAALFVPFMAGIGYAAALFLLRVLERFRARLALAWGGDPAPAQASLRILAAAAEWLRLALPWLVAALLALRALPDEGMLPNDTVRALVWWTLAGAGLFMGLRWAVRLALLPGRAGWRLPAIGDTDAEALARALVPLAGLLAADWAVMRAGAALDYAEALLALWTACACAGFLVLLRRARSAPGWTGGQGWILLRALAPLAAAVAVLVALAGFPSLAQFIVLGVMGSGLVLGAGACARLMLHECLPMLMGPQGRLGARLSSGLSVGREALRLAEFWSGLVLELAILLLSIVGLFVVWGATMGDIAVIWTRLIDGVRIGSYTFSLADVLLAGVVFALAVSVTRYVQRLFETRIFPRTTLDVGVRNSLRSGLGYVGLVIGAAMAVSTLGLNVSNLAFLAGALSVGIGFGLQNIVNNFVSGLILLIERPIKEGDWVVVGANQGIVQRINVRATEIQTFDRSTVLVPNADFLQTHVVNWTHKDLTARVEVVVQVAHSRGDAASLREVLLDCARSHPSVLPGPAPAVLLRDLGAGTYTFELACVVPDALHRAEVASDLRIAIDAALRARGEGAPAPAASPAGPSRGV